MAAESVARAALAEITPEATIGDLRDEVAAEDGVSTLTFAALLSGYPGWHWTVSVAQLPDEEPTVLEAELLPGDGALLAPDWVPWAERLEEYRAAQAVAGAADEPDSAESAAETDGDEDDDDFADDEDDDFGDDPDDGIDFESADSAAAAVGVGEQDEPESEPDEGGPEPAETP